MATTRLVQGLFGSEFRSTSNLFGLGCGQMRGHNLFHNAGWYNERGEKLGWGDLSPADLQRIAAELEDGEVFAILYEGDSYWNFVQWLKGEGMKMRVQPTVEAPGVEYVHEKCAAIITRGRICFVNRRGDEWTREYLLKRHDLTAETITAEEARGLLAVAA